MIKHTVIEGAYADVADVRVEIEETVAVQTVTRRTCCTARECQDTIALLNARKAEAVAAFDAELAVNQERLEAVQLATAEVKLMVAEPMVAEEL